MKPKILSILTIAALLLASCSSEDNETDNSPVELRISSGVEVLLKSTANTQENKITSGETVSLWVNDAVSTTEFYKANQLTADGNNGFSYGTAMYFPQTGNPVNIYALHGNFSTEFVNGDPFPMSTVEYIVPADQSAGGTVYTNADLLYAYSDNVARNGNPTTASLRFYHMLSKLELAIKIGSGAPALASSGAVTLGNNDITMNGGFRPSTTATMTNQAERAAMLYILATPTTRTLTLGQQTSTDFTDPNIVYNEAILVPQDMSGKVFAFRLANGGTLKYTIPTGTTFESGKKYRYHITLNLTGLQVSSTIENWEAVNHVQGNAEMD